MTAIKLNNKALKQLPNEILLPQYDRTQLRAGIVHIGLGNFHRAHQAWYIHRLMQEGKAHNWAIIGAGTRPADAIMRKKLLEQDCLFTLIELDPLGNSMEVCGSIIDFVPVEEHNATLIAVLSNPEIRLVSLTVTEGGYYYDSTTGKLDITHPDIISDANNPDTPKTAFGAIVAALKALKQAGKKPFTIQSCDNLQGNGNIIREVVCSLARLSDPVLADWIETHTCFPNSMVDCIVPATNEDTINQLRDIGVDDSVPVAHENFRQWVIQDQFYTDRPPWESVGATISHRVHDYESMKLKILNAGHQIIANAGELLGLETIDQCVNHPLISRYFSKVQTQDIIPLVSSVPDMSGTQYLHMITKRFANAKINDTTRRVAFDGSSRHSGFLIPIIQDAIMTDASIKGLALVEAVWARMCEGTRENGSVIEPNDPFWPDLNKRAILAKSQPLQWLKMSSVYADLSCSDTFSELFSYWLDTIWTRGLEDALHIYLNE